MDYRVSGPTGNVVLEGAKERQGDFVFTANNVGDYKFCFSNDMSTFAEKMVDFEIAVSTQCIGEGVAVVAAAIYMMDMSVLRIGGLLMASGAGSMVLKLDVPPITGMRDALQPGLPLLVALSSISLTSSLG